MSKIINIDCPTSEADILYSTDGTTPSTSYTGEVELTDAGTYTIRSVATKDGYLDSVEVTEEVTVEKTTWIYGFHISSSTSDPSDAVTYTDDNADYTPAYMDFDAEEFNWGSWSQDEFFMPRPCMVKYDGTVDYYLDPDNYTLKEDGTESDVDDITYEGNAMMEWGRDGNKIWYSITPDSGTSNTSATVRFSNYQVDSTYHCWSFINENNEEVDHFYTPIYMSSYYSSKMRSMSGRSQATGYTMSNQRTYSQNNGDGWDMEVYADVILINLLLTLLGKSLDTQSVYGMGTAVRTHTTGYMDQLGMFYGTSESGYLKVFGMEYWWGSGYRRILGFLAVNRVPYFKLTAGTADGSTATDYSVTSQSGYITGGTSLPSTSSYNYIRSMTYHSTGYVWPTAVTSSSSSYYCDYMSSAYSSSTDVVIAMRGAYNSTLANYGAWFWDIIVDGTVAYTGYSGALSFKPV